MADPNEPHWSMFDPSSLRMEADQPKDYPERTRFVRNSPSVLLRMVRAKDEELNRYKHSLFGSPRLGDVLMFTAGGLAMIVLGVGLVLYFGTGR